MTETEFKKHWKVTEWATRHLSRPHAFIQWKGTKVCMDCYCICGDQFHIDADFAYAVICPRCKRTFQMSAMIKMREIDPSTWPGCTPVMGEGELE